jgi:excisionase family DNA binding protein
MILSQGSAIKERTDKSEHASDWFFENQLLSYKQAAQYLSVSEAYLRKLKAKGHIPFVLVGDRAVRFRVSSLNQWVEEREVK